MNTLKKQLILFSLGLMTLSSMAQKNELKAVEKALKKNNITEATSAIVSADGLVDQMDAKLKAKYYFLKGQLQKAKKQYEAASETFQTLKAYEQEVGKQRYSSKVAPLLSDMIKEVSESAIKLYNDDKDYSKAAKNFHLTYVLSPQDTSFLFNAAISATQAKEFDAALSHYKELKRVGYTGISVMYMAKNTKTGEYENLGSKVNRDFMIKSDDYSDPKDESSPSKRADIIESIALILVQQGKTEEAMVAVKEARQANPKDLNLLLTEADLYIKLEKMDEFGKLMEEAVKISPDDPNLFYNLGVVNSNQGNVDEAKKYYLKAIELKPDYADAYTNLAVAILSKEQSIIDEMNKNLSNFKKYDALENQQKDLYKEALPYLEKSDEYNRTIDSVRSLLNIYDVLEMDDKSKEFRALYKSMK